MGAMYKAKVRLYTYYQGPDNSLANHMNNFKDLMNSIEYHGGEPFYDEKIVKYEKHTAIESGEKKAPIEEYRKRSINKSKDICF